MFHPMFGELITSREAADLTGFSMNQLRYQRSMGDKAEIPFVKQGGNSWYRKDDIDAWVEANGGANWEYSGSTSARTELRNPTAVGERRAHLAELAKITTKNSWSVWNTWFTENNTWRGGNIESYDKVKEWMIHYFRLTTGGDLDLMYPDVKSFNLMRRNNPTDFWPAITYAMRRAVSEVRGYNATDEEIIAAPIGDNPPLKLEGY